MGYSVKNLWFFVFVLLAFTFMPQGTAQGREPAKLTQFLFVIDDSGSMSGRNATDPDRLAVFCSAAVMSMLDDTDEVALIRLNGDASEDMDIRPLSESRSAIDGQLALDGTLAAYKGPWTPCRSAMERAKDLLNKAHRPGVFQVVMFLTDGACEPQGQDVVPENFLSGLDSHKVGRFQFHLLRFTGLAYSKNLSQLAKMTKGIEIEVSSSDPSAILFPFAKALSRSQGYEAYVLSARDNTLKAHQGARRIRLLAVAPDEGSELRISLSSRGQGNPSREMGTQRSGTHRYEIGKKYRYAAADYAPSDGGSVVSVTGASNWKVVVFPEYKLVLNQKVLQGSCESKGAPAHSIDEGVDICAVIELVNDEEQPVSDLGYTTINAFVDYTAAGGTTEQLQANREGAGLSFLMGKSRLEGSGQHRMRPYVRLTFQDSHMAEFTGTPWGLDVSSSRIRCTPAEINIGDLVPGSEHLHSFQCDGNFPPTNARLVVQNASALPPCIKFDINGKTEGMQITSGQPYTLGVRIGAFCGVTAINRQYAVDVQLEFAQGATKLPSQNLQTQFKLNSNFACAFEPVEIKGGKSTVMEFKCNSNAATDLEYTLMLPDLSDGKSNRWDAKYLKIGFANEDNGIAQDDAGGTLRMKNGKLSSDGAGDPLRLVLAADRCCSDGDNELNALFVPRGPSYQPKDAVKIPIKVQSVSPGIWSCHGPMILTIIGILLLTLLVAYVVNMFRNSSFINVDALSGKFVPLIWDKKSESFQKLGDIGRKDLKKLSKQLRNGGLSSMKRAQNWFKANPLKFGLPGGKFVETARVTCKSGSKYKWTGLISVSLTGDANYEEKLKSLVSTNDAGRNTGMLFVRAHKAVPVFFSAVNVNNEIISEMCDEVRVKDVRDGVGEDLEEKLRVKNIRNRELVYPDDPSERAVSSVAGWKIG